MQSGGVERGTIEIAEAIIAKGWRAVVASEGGRMADELQRKKAEHITLPLATKNPFKIWRNAAKLTSLIQREDISLIHARSRAPAWSAYLAAKRTGIPFVTTFHGTYNFKSKLKKRYNSVMTRGDLVIAISTHIAKHLRQEYEVSGSKIRLIPRGADRRRFDPALVQPMKMQELSAIWGVGDDHPPLILLPGRLTRWKGQHIFIEALSKLKNQDWMAVIMGDDKGHHTYRESLQAQIAELGLQEKIRFAPNTAHMPEAYALCSLVVSASVEPEAFGRIPVEAQAMGKLIIATNHGGATETVLDGKGGWLVEPDNAQALADAMDEALGLDEATRDEIRSTGYAHAVKHYTTEQMQEKTIAVYEELLHG